MEDERPAEATAGSTIADWTDRRAWAVFALFATACLLGQILRARAKPFWLDEIYTILHSSLPTIGTMWRAGVDGVDLTPPLNALLTRGVQSLFGVGPVITRAVPMFGYLVMSGVVFKLLKARANTVTALSGALLPCFTAAYPMAYEARPYGMMVGLFAVSLLAWTEAARDDRKTWSLVLLAAALGASLWNHYYAVLTFVPIGVGELVRTLRRRQVDIGVLGAIVAALVIAMPLWPLVATASGQSAGFWAAVTPDTAGSTLVHAYQAVLAGLTGRRAAVTALAVGGLALFAAQPRSRSAEQRSLPAHEVAAGLVALLIPAIGIAVGLLVTGVFTPRYAMSVVVGASLVVPLVVWQRNTKAGIAELVLCAVLVAHFGYDVGRTAASPPVLRDPYLTRPVLQQAVASGQPVFVASGLEYLPFWYYAPKDQKSRLQYLARFELESEHRMFDTGYIALSRWTTLPVVDFWEYVAHQPEFMVYVADANRGWLLDDVTSNGGTVEEMATAPGEQLFRVQMRPERLADSEIAVMSASSAPNDKQAIVAALMSSRAPR